MTDHQMTLLAARAARMWLINDDPQVLVVNALQQYEVWAPLEDEGAALRLANRLRLSITHCPDGSSVVVTGDYDIRIREQAGDDLNAATNRAIVQAAAALGMLL